MGKNGKQTESFKIISSTRYGILFNNTLVKDSKFVHPYIRHNLFTYLRTKIPTGGLSESLFKEYCDCQKPHYSGKREVLLKVNEKLSFRGLDRLGIPPYSIECNSESPRNMKERGERNKETDQVFSACEVNFGADDNGEAIITTVRIFAIVTLSTYKNKTTTKGSEKARLCRTILVCAPLMKDINPKESFIKNDSLLYDFEGNVLQIYVVDLSSVVRPACVIPIFNEHFPIDHKEKYEDLLASQAKCGHHWRNRRFLFVPIYQMHYFTVINFVNGMRDNKGKKRYTKNINDGEFDLCLNERDLQEIENDEIDMATGGYDSDEIISGDDDDTSDVGDEMGN